MPNFDTTGPLWKGSKTGRGLGSCSHNGTEAISSGNIGRGCCGGRGLWRGKKMGGWCCGWQSTGNDQNISPEDQGKFLESKLEIIRNSKNS